MKPEPRRSMSVALQTTDLPSEAIALIKAGTPKPQRLPRALELPVKNTVSAETNAPDENHETEPQSDQDANSNPMRPGSITLANEVAATARLGERPSGGGNMIPAACASSVSLTVRVPSGLPLRLLRAATDRKINQQSPFTQQEIVAQALEQWLQTHG
jgi:hypothetical protein